VVTEERIVFCIPNRKAKKVALLPEKKSEKRQKRHTLIKFFPQKNPDVKQF